MSTKIKQIEAREILDSHGYPTVEVKVTLSSGMSAKASVPSGASTGEDEACELRDGVKSRYSGKGVLKAVRNVNTVIEQELRGMDASNQEKIDKTLIKLDGTKNKEKLGANAILGVSLACARVSSQVVMLPLYQYIREVFDLKLKGYKMPIPTMNIFNGGKHADTNLDFQEFMIIPHLLPSDSFKDRVRAGAEIFHQLGVVLRAKGYDTDSGNEGGYAPNIEYTTEALDMIMQAIREADYAPKHQVSLGMDVGSSTLYDKRKKEYVFKLDGSYLHSDQLIVLYSDWLKKYPFISIEDGLDENDWSGWTKLYKELGKKVLIVGDDLLVTNVRRLKKSIKEKAANAAIVKPNQIGTLTETINFVQLARANHYKTSVAHRSGETNDDFVADLAVAINSDFVKFGSLSRGERLAKWNRMMEIEDEIEKL